MRRTSNFAHVSLLATLLATVLNCTASISAARADEPTAADGIAVRSVADGLEVLRRAGGRDEVVGRLALPGPIHDVLRRGATVWVARGRLGVTVVDVGNPAAPREVGTFGGGERPAVRLALSGDTLLVIIADFATRAYDVRDPARPTDTLLLGGPSGAAQTATPMSSEPATHGTAAAPTTEAPAASRPNAAIGARELGEVTAVRKGYLSVQMPGAAIGDRLELRSRRMISVSDPTAGKDIQAPSNERLGVVEVERVKDGVAMCRMPRGVHAEVGDQALPTTEVPHESLFFPRRYMGGMWRFHGALRPMLSVDRLGFGFISDVALDYQFALPIRIGIEAAPLSFLAQGQDPPSNGGYGNTTYTNGGTGVDAHLRFSAAYSTDWFEIGLGLGGQFQRFGTTAFTISPRVRLGSMDGLHLTFQSDLALVDYTTSNGTSNVTSKRFNYAGGYGDIGIPLTRRVTLILEGGGADHLAWGILGLNTWLSGNGGPGTLIVHAGVGGAWISDQTPSCPYNSNDPSAACSVTKVSGAGPAASIGVDYRF